MEWVQLVLAALVGLGFGGWWQRRHASAEALATRDHATAEARASRRFQIRLDAYKDASKWLERQRLWVQLTESSTPAPEPNRALLPALADAGIPVRTMSGSETVAACSKLLDLVAEQGFRHLGQVELLQALRGAKSKAVGDAWCWSRKQSSGDAALVVAMTLALAVGSEIPVDAGDFHIY